MGLSKSKNTLLTNEIHYSNLYFTLFTPAGVSYNNTSGTSGYLAFFFFK